MAKIKLGARPKSFKKTLKFPMHDGTDGSIEVVYKYRTRKEFGAFIDSVLEAGRARAIAEEAEAAAARKKAEDAGETYAESVFSSADLHQQQAAANADYILQIIEGWDLEAPFNRDSVLQLCDELPAGATEIIEKYRAAIVEGRLGN